MNALAIERTPYLIAAEINSIKDQTQKMLLVNSIEIGSRLVEAKSMLPHGEWGRWLTDSVDYSQRTANNLMKIFEQYGDNQLSLFGSEAKSQAIANLSYTQAVALLGVPDEEREEFVKEHDVESMTTRELQQAIKEKQDLEQRLRETEAQAKKEKAGREKLAKEFKELELQNEDNAQAVDRLKQELETAKEVGNDSEVEQLQASLLEKELSLSESRKKIKLLERQLKEKPIEVPATQIVEKIPETVEKELAILREKAANQGGNQATIKFKLCFDSLVSEFNKLLGALEEIENEEIAVKYKKAVRSLIGKMDDRL